MSVYLGRLIRSERGHPLPRVVELGSRISVLPRCIARSPHGPDAELGYQAQDYRHSVAEAYRREDRGDSVDRCSACRCEIDVPKPAHDPRCRIAGSLAA